MVELLKGAPVAAALNEKITAEAEALKERGIFPALAILRVGEKPDDIAYENGAAKRCEKLGISVRRVALKGDASTESLVGEIERLNSDKAVHGVLLLRPLPAHIDEAAACNALAPEKDVDGVTNASLAGVFTGLGQGFPPCTPEACMEILDYYGIDPMGKRAVVAGRSLVVGKPAAMMLLKKHATVTICHTKTAGMQEMCQNAEILVAAIGRANVIDKSHLSHGQIILDVGINVLGDGGMCGDVNFAHAKDIVKSITPVPGGVGTVTTSVLAKHVVEAARNLAG